MQDRFDEYVALLVKIQTAFEASEHFEPEMGVCIGDTYEDGEAVVHWAANAEDDDSETGEFLARPQEGGSYAFIPAVQCEVCGDFYVVAESDSKEPTRFCSGDCDSIRADAIAAHNEDTRCSLDYDHSMDG